MCIYIALVHYPVLNRYGEIVSTAITTVDLHDIARVGKTYEVKGFFVVHPVRSQRELASRIVQKWRSEIMIKKDHPRADALSIIRISSDIQEVIDTIEKENGLRPDVIVTSAKLRENVIDYEKMREHIKTTKKPLLILFGTGWGLTKEVIDNADYLLQPIEEERDYNHLSVRSAVSIILDRLLAQKKKLEVNYE